eukprot:UN23991
MYTFFSSGRYWFETTFTWIYNDSTNSSTIHNLPMNLFDFFFKITSANLKKSKKNGRSEGIIVCRKLQKMIIIGEQSKKLFSTRFNGCMDLQGVFEKNKNSQKKLKMLHIGVILKKKSKSTFSVFLIY